MGRIITVVFDIEDIEAAKPIWFQHGSGQLLLGSQVRSISEGDCSKALSKLEDFLDKLADDGEIDSSDYKKITNIVNTYRKLPATK